MIVSTNSYKLLAVVHVNLPTLACGILSIFHAYDVLWSELLNQTIVHDLRSNISVKHENNLLLPYVSVSV